MKIGGPIEARDLPCGRSSPARTIAAATPTPGCLAPVSPLGRLIVARSYTRRGTKTEVTRRVPIHPTLAKVIAAWKLSHWERIYGRKPGVDDFIVPARTMRPINSSQAQKYFLADLAALELRAAAGTRNRGGHDLRSWFIATAQEHGAHRDLLRVVTHTAKRDVMDGYTRAPWPALCAEVLKLKVEILGAEVLVLSTPRSTLDQHLRNRWRNMATPAGFEPASPA